MIQGVDKLTTPSYLVVALAVNGNKKTKYVVRWALDKFVPEGILLFKLILVRPKITRIPTPMGVVPASQVRDDVVIAYKKEVEWQAYEKLLPFKNMCAKKKVQVEILQIESDDVVDAIKQEIVKGNINKLVIGASSSGMFSRGKVCRLEYLKAFRVFVQCMRFQKGNYHHSGLLILIPLDRVKMITVVIQVLSPILQEQSGQTKGQLLLPFHSSFQLHYQCNDSKHFHL